MIVVVFNYLRLKTSLTLVFLIYLFRCLSASFVASEGYIV